MQSFPNLQVVIQDSNSTMLHQAQGSQDLSDIKDRISFDEYDFFTPQPVTNAGAFLMRQILHNWGDDDCVRILQAVVPGLERSAPGTPLLINDSIIPEPGTTTRFEEHVIRQIDLLMMFSLGAKQRTVIEFQRLLKRADARFEVRHLRNSENALLIPVHIDHENSHGTNGSDRSAPKKLLEYSAIGLRSTLRCTPAATCKFVKTARPQYSSPVTPPIE